MLPQPPPDEGPPPEGGRSPELAAAEQEIGRLSAALLAADEARARAERERAEAEQQLQQLRQRAAPTQPAPPLLEQPPRAGSPPQRGGRHRGANPLLAVARPHAPPPAPADGGAEQHEQSPTGGPPAPPPQRTPQERAPAPGPAPGQAGHRDPERHEARSSTGGGGAGGALLRYRFVTPNGPFTTEGDGSALLEGVYAAEPGSEYNGEPVWRREDGKYFLYNGMNERWHVTDSAEDFPHCVGLLASAPHRGAPPHRVPLWQRWEGASSTWAEDPGVCCLAVGDPDEGAECAPAPAAAAARPADSQPPGGPRLSAAETVLALGPVLQGAGLRAALRVSALSRALRAALLAPAADRSLWTPLWEQLRARPPQKGDAGASPLVLLQGDDIVVRQVVWALGRSPQLALKPGLSEGQLERAELRYGFRWPPDLRLLLRHCVPCGGEWHDWHEVLSAAAGGGPGSDTEAQDTVAEAIEAHGGAPELYRSVPLVPVVGSYMIPSVPPEEGNPVYAMHHGSDNTLAAANLWEFLCACPDAMGGPGVALVLPASWRRREPRAVPYWADLVVS
eukprot:TRINITY_DN37311_c0_g1_i1.p1 TRINITY_DN37311_c0_g1~~TRINITY_DN37311_c0_g1_i1.p1  ORF type:complete len:584 (+),score=189.15 TRINITY_DN37311_c0_g1_i1:64-1752(+)